MTNPRLKVDGLCKSFFGVSVLQDVSFEIGAGQVLGIVGENGSGKSTTMNLLTGVLPPDAGAIHLDGERFATLGSMPRKTAAYDFYPNIV